MSRHRRPVSPHRSSALPAWRPAAQRPELGPLERDRALIRSEPGPLERDPALIRSEPGPLERDPALIRSALGPLGCDRA